MAVGAAGLGGTQTAAEAASGPSLKEFIDKRTKKVVKPLDKKLRVHPYLQYGAQVDPDRLVRVIVQMKDRNGDKHDVAKRVGKRVLKDLPLATGFTVEIPLKLALKLAEHPHVRYVSYDSPLQSHAIDVSKLKTPYTEALGLPQLWNGSIGATGQGITVAVLDSGANVKHPALTTGVTSVVTNGDSIRANDVTDANGHGTHVAGIITGFDPGKGYIGVAPNSKVIALKIANRFGVCSEGDLIDGLQWVYNNRIAHNIKVVNLSISGAAPNSYLTSPLSACVEQLWMAGVTVVVAAGNRGASGSTRQTWYAPGNDPFVITVGAIDDNNTASLGDDSIAPYSSRGATQDSFYKPDVMAPGRKIAAPLSGPKVVIARQHPTQIVDEKYIRLSGTSMATPVIVGVVALLLEKYPTLTPNQIKWLLVNTARSYPGKSDSAGMVDVATAFQRAALGLVPAANAGLLVNTAVDPLAATVSWTASYWESSYWESSYWESSYWESSYWEAAAWEDNGADDPNTAIYDPTTDPNFLTDVANQTW